MAAIKRESLVDKVYDQLKNEIIFLQRPLGTKLKVSDLEKELGLSCTPIREAVNRLQQEGLVTYTTNVGVSIISLNHEDIEEVQELTSALHRLAIHLSLKKNKPEILVSELEKALTALKNAVTPKEEAMAVNRFMGVFYKHSGNKRLDRSMLTVQGQLIIIRNLYANLKNKDKSVDIRCYTEMLEGTRVSDEDRVVKALMENVSYMNAQLAN